jgi:hypothetical protein
MAEKKDPIPPATQPPPEGWANRIRFLMAGF